MALLLLTLSSFYLYSILKYRSAFYILQQNSYNTSNRYVKWIFKNFNKTLLDLDIIFVPVIILASYIVKGNFFNFFIFGMYLIAFYYELKKIKKQQQKKPFVHTPRIKRLMVTTIILFIIISFTIYLDYNKESLTLYYIIYALFGYLSYFITILINFLNRPIEQMVYLFYRNKATSKLDSMPNLIRIGVTGSYGKTTSKNIINSILNSKYNSYTTPKSFNTPYGLIKSINDGISKFDNVAIFEMGACKPYDIKELCDLVHPKYGIITKIGLAHLETFKKIEITTKTKFELVESLPAEGVAVLNADDENQRNYQIQNKVKVIWIGIDKEADVNASNIKLSNEGMTFDVIFKKDNTKHKFTTPLLGKFNIYNILCGLALGKELGIKIEDMEYSISKLKPTEHRLELIKSKNYTIIDDAYNSNPEGSKMALEVLDMMPGKKIIVTPGMVELGEKQYELNKEFGKQISEVADEVILIGQKQTTPIYDGLMEAGYKVEKVHILNDVKESFKLAEKLRGKDTYVLLENDLPDIFNEG